MLLFVLLLALLMWLLLLVMEEQAMRQGRKGKIMLRGKGERRWLRQVKLALVVAAVHNCAFASVFLRVGG